MTRWGKSAGLPSATVCLLLGGCGTYTPDIVPGNPPNSTAFMINGILDHVKCELGNSVQYIIDYDKRQAQLPTNTARHLQWLEGQSAKITIKLVVDEKGSLNPGVSYKQLLPGVVTTFPNKTSVTTNQSFSLGLGGTLSSDATRTEMVDYTFSIKNDFLANKVQYSADPNKVCQSGGLFITGDLKIRDWLFATTFPFYLPNNAKNPPDVLSHEVAFVIVANGNITPSWTLVSISANTAGSLVAAGRTDTGDVIVSIGPSNSPKLQSAHDIAKINSGFSTALKNQ